MAGQLRNRISKLSTKDITFKNNLKLAYDLMEKDPPLALAKIRMTLETVISKIYQQEKEHTPKTINLRSLLKTDFIHRVVDKRIITRMHTIRSIGNIGIHDGAVNAEDAKMGLENLCDVMDWYFEKYETESSNERKGFRLSLKWLWLIPIFGLGYFIWMKALKNTDTTPYILKGDYVLEVNEKEGPSKYELHLEQDNTQLNGTGSKQLERGFTLGKDLQPQIKAKGRISKNKTSLLIEEFDQQLIYSLRLEIDNAQLEQDTININKNNRLGYKLYKLN
jgi:hypothetical protein